MANEAPEFEEYYGDGGVRVFGGALLGSLAIFLGLQQRKCSNLFGCVCEAEGLKESRRNRPF